MTLPSYLVDFFSALNAEENVTLKKAFEGDLSDVGNFPILTRKYLENNEVLLGEIIPKFMVTLRMEEIKKFVLEVEKKIWKKNLMNFAKNQSSTRASFMKGKYNIMKTDCQNYPCYL